MARPVDMKKRSELARAAAEILCAKAPAKVTMSELADDLDIKRPTLYFYFPEQRDILEHALKDIFVEQTRFILDRMLNTPDPLEQLYEQVKAIHDFHQGRERLMVFLGFALFSENDSDQQSDLLKRVDCHFASIRKIVAENLEKEIEEGKLRPFDVGALMSVTQALVDGLMLQRVFSKQPLEPAHQFFREHILESLRQDVQMQQSHAHKVGVA